MPIVPARPLPRPRVRRSLAGLLLAGLFAAACGGAVGDPEVAARVEGEVITVAEVREAVGEVTATPGAGDQDTPAAQREAAARVLTRLVVRELLKTILDDLGIAAVTDEEIQERIEQIRAQLSAQGQDLDTAIGQLGITPAELDDEVRLGIIAERVQQALSADVDIADEEVAALYEQSFNAPSVRHILVETEAEAQDVIDQLAGGADFAELAMEVSLDPGSAARGGDLGPFQPGQFVEEFEQAVLDAEDGEVVGPVETQFGFHVIQRQPPAELADVEDEIRESLRQQRGPELFQDLLGETFLDADVTVNPRFGQWLPDEGRVAVTDPLGDLREVPQNDLPTALPGGPPVPTEAVPTEAVPTAPASE